jgi:hypothetical protein
MDEDDTVTLNIGGEHFVTTMKTIRRVPHTFWSAYFSGNFAQRTLADGSHFIDRNAEHFPHVLTFMRDGILTVNEIGARPTTMLLRAVKREFEFYGIEVVVYVDEESEIAMFIGGNQGPTNVEQFMMPEEPSRQMGTTRSHFGAAVIDGDIYVTGGINQLESLSSMEIFSHETGLWSDGPPMPVPASHHVLVAVGQDLYNIGGLRDEDDDMIVMKFHGRSKTWHLLHTKPLTGTFSECTFAVVGTIIYFFDTVESVFTFNTTTEVWHKLPDMPSASFTYGSSASVCDGFIYIVGPHGLTCFDPDSEVCTTLASPLLKPEDASTFVLDGVLHVAGGSTNGSSVERYSVLNDTWEMVVAMKEERSHFYAVTICRSHVEQKDIFEILIERSLRKETLVELQATLADDTELATKMHNEALTKISAEMHANVCAQWRLDVYAQMNDDHDVVAEIRTTIRAEIHAKVYDEVYEDLRSEIRSDFDVNSKLLNELRQGELVAIRTRLRQEIESDGALMGRIRREGKHHRS